MSGLVLNLKAYEKVLVGKVVLQNGSRRSQMRVLDEHAGVLRLEDAMHPDDVKTPLSRAYFAAQLVILEPTGSADQAAQLMQLLHEASVGFSGFSMVSEINKAIEEAENCQYYKVLKRLRPLLPKEAALLLAIERSPEALTHYQPKVV